MNQQEKIDCQENHKTFIEKIRGKLNLIEEIHKTLQLSQLELSLPILNETRYLARALVDSDYFAGDAEKQEEYKDAIAKAELAANCAINDGIDILIVYIKKTIVSLQTKYPKYEIANSVYAKEYLNVLQSIFKLDQVIIDSRINREKRPLLYANLYSDYKQEFKNLAKFALKLFQIEYEAQQYNNSLYSPASIQSEINIWTLKEFLNSLANKPSEGKVEIYMQPKYQVLHNKKCIGAELLLRFFIQDKLVPTQQLIQLVESSVQFPFLFEWVSDQALLILKSNPNLPNFSINVSAKDLLVADFALNLINKIRNSGVAANRLELEITEGIAIDDMASKKYLEELSKFGCKIVIDDFGTGETKFSYLATLPISSIKIDKSMIDNFALLPDKYSNLIKAINAVGQSCNLDIIAEGIETDELSDKLISIGIKNFQGYLYGKPLPIKEFFQAHSTNFANI